MQSDVLESDVITRSSSLLHMDGDKYHLEETRDAEDIVEMNKAAYASIDERSRWGRINRVASIPLVLFFDLWKKGYFRGNKLSKDDKKWLNDNENRFFRTRPGRV